jgi:hypothetical protein
MRSVDAKCRCEDVLMRRYIDGKVYPSSIQLTDSNYLLSRHFFSVTTSDYANERPGHFFLVTLFPVSSISFKVLVSGRVCKSNAVW